MVVTRRFCPHRVRAALSGVVLVLAIGSLSLGTPGFALASTTPSGTTIYGYDRTIPNVFNTYAITQLPLNVAPTLAPPAKARPLLQSRFGGFVAAEDDLTFDQARREAFDLAFGKGNWEDNPDIVATKWDDATGTATEFKGPGGAKVGYDAPHPNTPGPYHDTQHISWQSAGKRYAGGQRGNIPYVGPLHPSR